MACCLTAPSHYLNQCWLIIRGVLWHTSESSFAGIAQGIDSGYEFEKDILKNIFKSPRGQWVKFHVQKLLSSFVLMTISVLVHKWVYMDGLVQDYSISIAKALDILQSCTKPVICNVFCAPETLLYTHPPTDSTIPGFVGYDKSMDYYKTAAMRLPMHWSYHSPALSHRSNNNCLPFNSVIIVKNFANSDLLEIKRLLMRDMWVIIVWKQKDLIRLWCGSYDIIVG